ncbi:MAG: GntR family transcriptional regulator [Thermovirgaceae bacterium]|nr:GntR family transcriptional regulator [Synergistales bacterium]MDI9391745.1 GntR family transcriptional regulator [Synergistota bacterium]MDY0179265.1 GntR family transcriptional regulator [Synergistaceae bacterium]HRW88208.1 GntR family transcriptional regulator [Thermovirgaceae bacterium]MDD3133544.1 GntR family transcriptional regulator [Synergistales bacterium]
MIMEPRLYTTSADYVYQELRHRIITKQLKPGQRLPEVNIAVQMGVSRTPVREALRRLASEGLVLIIPNSGARLASPTRREMEDTYAVREQLECISVAIAATRISERNLRRLEDAILEEEKAFEEKNLELYLEVNENFHRIIAEASGNRVLAEFVENILARTNAYVVFYDPFYDIEDNPSISQHKAIAQALREREREKAVDLMREHLKLSLYDLNKPS